MTHNVVAQFSCSVYTAKDAELNRIPPGKVQGDFKDYQVINGSIFNDEYNETLDSATILLSQIEKQNRLKKINAYQFVRVFDKSTWDESTGKYTFDNIYLLDNFDETENNINEHIFGYVVNLMSLTKFLEKIQCPNLNITHEIVNGVLIKKTIYQKMVEYFDLYVPKMKFSEDGIHWSYRPLIEIRSGDEHSNSLYFSEIEVRDFVPAGDDWEVTAYVDLSYFSYLEVDEDDINKDSIKIKNVTVRGDITLTQYSVTFDKTTNRFVFNGIANQLPETGSLFVDFDIDYLDSFFEQRFSAKCADLSFNCPTMRQLITTLMQQVGCIPTVKRRVLSYLDFQKDAVKFGGSKGYTINNTVNKIKRGLSSDSYVNTLLNISQNVLDSGNEVLCETLGFRDRNKALLRQQDNLFLETKFPIYKVNFFQINAYVKSNTNVKGIQSNMSVGVPGDNTKIIQWRLAFSKPDDNHVTLDFGMSIDAPGVVSIKGDIVAFKYNFKEPQVIRNIEILLYGSDYQIGVDDVYTAELTDSTFDMFYFNGFITVYEETETYARYKYATFYPSFESRNNLFSNLLTLFSKDITNLLVEESVRQNLSTNFVEMNTATANNPTLETLANYIYGTVGYNIGSNKIEGFSQTFVEGEATVTGWIEAGYTYIENIWKFITTYYKDEIKTKILKDFANMPIVHDDIWVDDVLQHEGDDANVEINSISGFNPWETTQYQFIKNLLFISDINFVSMWFDIKYQPLNSFNMAYVKSKEHVDFLLQQYDGNASGITDFDRLSIHEQEQVDRIGNEVLTINQRTSYFSDIQDFYAGPLYFKDDTNRDGSVDEDSDIDDSDDENDNGINYIVFKRSFTINNNCFNANYVGSKDAVLKDYFTSIRTKYRAYNYVDYSQSIVRKERDTFFVKISEKGWYNGDDKVFFGELNQQNSSSIEQRRKLSWLIPSNPYRNEDKYIFSSVYNTIAKDSVVAAKNDISKISYDNFISFVYEEYDNVSAGSYIPSYAHTQTLWSLIFDNGNTKDGSIIGGVPQKWQIWENDFYVSHQVGFYSKLDLNEIFNTFVGAIDETTKAEIEADLQKVYQMPIVSPSLLENKAIFHIMDDNTDFSNGKRTFYKDLSERINHTVQFIYYTDSKNVVWNEDFLAARFNALPNAMSAYLAADRRIVDLTGKELLLNKEEYFSSDAPLSVSMAAVEYVVSNETNPYILVRWDLIPSEITQFKIVEVRTLGSHQHYLRDIIAFKRGEDEEQKFYITLNDTKSDYVMAERDGILYRRYKVRQNTSERLVDKIHDL